MTRPLKITKDVHFQSMKRGRKELREGADDPDHGPAAAGAGFPEAAGDVAGLKVKTCPDGDHLHESYCHTND